jgi:hypothetical protein
MVQGQPDPASPKSVREIGRYCDLPTPTSCNVTLDDPLTEIHPREDIIWGEVMFAYPIPQLSRSHERTGLTERLRLRFDDTAKGLLVTLRTSFFDTLIKPTYRGTNCNA